MRKNLLAAAIGVLCLPASTLAGDADIEILRDQLRELREDYQQRIETLERRLDQAERAAEAAQGDARKAVEQAQAAPAAPAKRSAANDFNPAISVILNGRYAAFDQDPDDYALPGFQLANEGGLGDKGFSAGHSEVVMDANVDDKFYGRLTAALASHDGETELELEEAFIETLGLGNGLTLRGGRFFSDIGYLNNRHPHAWDFADAPLIYRGLFGDQYYDDGARMSWIAPTDTYLRLGGELFAGGRFPAGSDDDIGAYSLFAEFGGDLGAESSWQLGLSYWSSDVNGRTAVVHAHGDEDDHEHEEEHDHEDDHSEEWLFADSPAFTGDSDIYAVDLVWKWAPNGNPKSRNLTLQAEYFRREERGELSAIGEDEVLTSPYDGEQSGWYAQAVYQFMPGWRVGGRYDRLSSDNRADEEIALDLAGLHDEGHTPERYSLMLDWSNSEYSRVRLQYNRDESQPLADDQLFLQYIHSLGAHGAHSY